MIRLLRRWIKDFLWSEKAARASLRSFITFLAATGSIVVASASDATGHVNFEIIGDWNFKAWALRLGFGAMFAAAARISSGEKNPSVEEIRQMLSGPPKP